MVPPGSAGVESGLAAAPGAAGATGELAPVSAPAAAASPVAIGATGAAAPPAAPAPGDADAHRELAEEPPMKRKRGRPRSLVFNYFVREDEDGMKVNRCVFCGFRSRDKSQNPTYLARHCITACSAPRDVVELLQKSRLAASHHRKSAAPADDAEEGEGAVAVDVSGNTASPATASTAAAVPIEPAGHDYRRMSMPHAETFGALGAASVTPSGRRASVGAAGLPVPAPSVLLHSPQFSRQQQPSQAQSQAQFANPIGAWPKATSPVLSAGVGVGLSGQQQQQQQQAVLGDDANASLYLGDPLFAQALKRPQHEKQEQRITGGFQGLGQPLSFDTQDTESQRRLRRREEARQQEEARRQEQDRFGQKQQAQSQAQSQPALFRDAADPFQQQQAAFDPLQPTSHQQERHSFRQQDRPGQQRPTPTAAFTTASREVEDEVVPSGPLPRSSSGGGSSSGGRLPPIGSSLKITPIGRSDPPAIAAAVSTAPIRHASLPSSLIPYQQPEEDLRKSLLRSCKAIVAKITGTPGPATLLCLGPMRNRSHASLGRYGGENRLKPFSSTSSDPTEGTTISGESKNRQTGTLSGSAYDGVCTVLAWNSQQSMAYLGSEDCFFSSNVVSLIAKSAGAEIERGAVSALLFACPPTDSAIGSLSVIQAKYQHVLLVLDVAHGADELCRDVAASSVSVTRCIERTVDISRFLALSGLCSDTAGVDLSSLRQLPNAHRFSAVVDAMLQLANNRQLITDALSSFERTRGPSRAPTQGPNDASNDADITNYANYTSRLLLAGSFTRELHESVRLLQPLSHIVSLYDDATQDGTLGLEGQKNGRVSSRGIHMVLRDCENALQALDAPIARQVAPSLLGDKKNANGAVGALAGNATILASHLDPSQPVKASPLESWQEQRIYHAIHICCIREGKEKVDKVWYQLNQFLYYKDTLFSTDALKAARTVTPINWWARFGRAAVPDLCSTALIVLSIPVSIGCGVARTVAAATGADVRLRGAALRNDETKEHLYCSWNTRLNRLRDDELLGVGNPLDTSFRDLAALMQR